MKKRFLLGIILLSVSAFSAWYYFHETVAEETDQITLYGNVDLRQVNLAFQVSGQIREMLVTEGSEVKPGQELAVIDSTRYQAKLDSAKANVSALQAELDKLLAGNRAEEIAQAKNTYLATRTEAQQAQSSYERLKSLLPKKLASQDAVDNAKAKAKALHHQEIAAYNAWKVAELGARDEDLVRVRAQIAQAQAQVALAQKDFDDTVLRSPIGGIVRDRVLERGDLAQPQQVVMTLAVQNPKWVRAYIAETDLGKIKQGMPAEILTDSYPGKTYRGWVGYISPVAEFTPKSVQTEELRTQLVYQARIYSCDPSHELRLGMPATVTIDLQKLPESAPDCDVSQSSGQVLPQ